MNTADTPLRILIIADDPLARAGLATLLSKTGNDTVAGQVAATDDLVLAVTTYRPDVVLWDLGWSTSGSLERLAELASADDGENDVPLAVLIQTPDQVGDVWQVGVRTILLRQTTGPALMSALSATAQGLWVLAPQVANNATHWHMDAPTPMLDPLTPRELEVLQLLAGGLPNKAIARDLDISEHTVKFHVNSILSKLGAQSRTDAVVRATRVGLILL